MATRNSLSHTENLLRDLVERLLKKRDGEKWLDQADVPPARTKEWERRKTAEPKKRPGGRPEERLLYYSDLSDLRDIIDKNWDTGFDECFSDKERFMLDMKRLLAFRNPEAHSRELMPFEEKLLAGITEQLRQEITLFLSEPGDKGEPQHFARIEEVSDSFGNRVTGQSVDDAVHFMGEGPIVRPGDSIKFKAQAWDPEGKDVEWFIGTHNQSDTLKGLEWGASYILNTGALLRRFGIGEIEVVEERVLAAQSQQKMINQPRDPGVQ